jgi:hypothetical protein
MHVKDLGIGENMGPAACVVVDAPGTKNPLLHRISSHLKR